MRPRSRSLASCLRRAARIGALGVVALTAAATATAAVNAVERFQYVSPMPGSDLVSIWNNVAIRDGRPLDPTTLRGDPISVEGVTSGGHAGTLVLSDDGRTMVFTPDVPFALDEVVSVTLHGGVATMTGEPLPSMAFDFRTASVDPSQVAPLDLEPLVSEETEPVRRRALLTPTTRASAPSLTVLGAACGSTPPGYLPVDVTRLADPEPGYVFLTPLKSAIGRLEILDNQGNPIFFRQVEVATALELQSGRLTYYERTRAARGGPKFFAMDSAYALVDSFATGNGYVTDAHELRLLPNGHALLMSFDPQPVRMDTVVPGGRPNATMIGLVIQEIDAGKHVVFQWRSWDHYKITDVVSPEVDLRGTWIDYAHGNSIDLDADGNLLVSCRNMNEVTKIDRGSGAILWRWGLNARHNDFTFTNDMRGFSHQHHVRRLPNGHITLFNNGDYQVPEYSEAIEYVLDEEAKTATRVWSHTTAPPTYSWILGSVQRRPSGGTLIGFGGASKVVDVNANGDETLEFDLGAGVTSYRAFRFPWRTNLFTVDADSIDFGDVLLGTSATRLLTIWNRSSQPLELACIATTDAAFSVDAPVPLTIPVDGRASVPVTFRPGVAGPHEAKLYASKITSVEWIAQDVALHGRGNLPPDCSHAHASAETLWPADHRWVPVGIEGVADPDGDPVTITITSVRQDEPVDALSDGAGCPDAVIDGETVRLRAERAAQGNGRVIQVGFEASDGRGGVCAGTVPVCIPHDQGTNPQPCKDDGAEYDALGECPAPGRRGDLVAQPEESLTPALRPLRTDGTNAIVAYVIAHEADVTLALFDLSGRRVKMIARGPRAAGEHEVAWGTSELPPGVYYYQLVSGELSLTRSIVITR